MHQACVAVQGAKQKGIKREIPCFIYGDNIEVYKTNFLFTINEFSHKPGIFFEQLLHYTGMAVVIQKVSFGLGSVVS